MMSRHRLYGYTLAGPAYGLAIALICLGTGCHWNGNYVTGGCSSCNMPMVADTGGCGGGCGGACGDSCDSFPTSCASCGPTGVGFSGMMLPLLHSKLACGSGCGDVYWGEWISNPPECCDACNEGDCWAGSNCDGSYCGYDGYGCGYGHGFLAGPVAIIRGTYLGVTHVVQGTFSVLHCGYRSACGYPYYSTCGGCADCGGDGYSGEVMGGNCGSCGGSSCGGDCAQTGGIVRDQYAAAPAMGSGVRTARTERRVIPAQATRPTQQRIPNQRLRR